MTERLQPNAPDPRPGKTPGGIGNPKGHRRQFRRVATPAQWEKLREKKLGPCLVCRYVGVVQTLPSSLHHCVAKSLGGDDCANNLVSLCGTGTTGHHGLVEAHHPDTCRVLAAAIQRYDDGVYAYTVGKLGEDGWLRRYKVAS